MMFHPAVYGLFLPVSLSCSISEGIPNEQTINFLKCKDEVRVEIGKVAAVVNQLLTSMGNCLLILVATTDTGNVMSTVME